MRGNLGNSRAESTDGVPTGLRPRGTALPLPEKNNRYFSLKSVRSESANVVKPQ